MGKYFKYAIGEIILVVTGILIALQINNQNENRKEVAEINMILKTLYGEFSANKKLIEKTKLETDLKNIIDNILKETNDTPSL